MDAVFGERLMDLALDEARNAEKAGEVPVGAVIADAAGNVVARGFNQPISTHDPTAHAEIIAMRAAAQVVGNYRLTGLTLYCTMEPCDVRRGDRSCEDPTAGLWGVGCAGGGGGVNLQHIGGYTPESPGGGCRGRSRSRMQGIGTGIF